MQEASEHYNDSVPAVLVINDLSQCTELFALKRLTNLMLL